MYLGAWMYRKNILSELERSERFAKFLVDIGRVYPGPEGNPIKNRWEDNCECPDCALN